MSLTCRVCGVHYDVPELERQILKKVELRLSSVTYALPLPSSCPRCRERLRLSFRNEWSLYRRTSSISGKPIISAYPAESPYTVVDQDEWWSDRYDPLSFGKNFDFSRTFFEQFSDLSLKVPRAAIQNAKSENCAYTNYSAENKNCYMVVGGFQAEDSFYSYRVAFCRDVADCYDLFQCELCYRCTRSTNLYQSIHCTHCHNSSDLVLCEDCVGCHDCFGCIGLKNARYHILNRPFSAAEYQKRIAKLRELPASALSLFENFKRSHGSRGSHVLHSEECSGDCIISSQNCACSFALKNSRNCFYCAYGETNSDCAHANFFDNCELQYESANLEQNYGVTLSYLVWYCSDIYYSANCFNSQNLFGCIGMKKHRFCILNKAYSQSEYESLISRIVPHMRETGEWGQFFPPSLTPFAFNETTAFDYYPLSSAEAISLGYRWKSEEMGIQEESIPSNSSQCSQCSRPWRIGAAEALFYKKLTLRPPTTCWRCRQDVLAHEAGNRTLIDRCCHRCGKSTMTSEAVMPVVCEQCWSME